MSKRILLIDDDELLCDVLAGFLEAAGYEMTRAPNGRVGLAELDQGPQFDLILLDLLMPEMDGLRFLNAFSAGPSKNTPVLVLSASATADVVEALNYPCVAGVARKPAKPAALLERITALIGPG